MSGTNPFKRRRADTAGHDDRALSTRLDAQNLAHRATPQSLHTRVELWRTAAQVLGAERPSTPSIPQTPVRPSKQAPTKLPSQVYIAEDWFNVEDENGKIMRGKHGERLKRWLRSKPSSWHRSFDDALEDKAKAQMDRYQKALKVQSLRESAQRYEDWAALKREEALALSHELGADEEEDWVKTTDVVNRLFAGCMDEPVHPPGRPDRLDEELAELDYWRPISRSSPDILEVPTRGKGRASSARTRQSAPAATPAGKVSERWSHHAHEINDRTQTRCACKGSNANMQYRGSGDPCKLPCAGCSRFGAGCTAECVCGGSGLCANKFNSDGSRYGYLRHFFGADAEGRFPNARTGVPEPIYPTGCFVTWLWKETRTASVTDLPVVAFAEELGRHFTLRAKDTYADKEAVKRIDAWRKHFNMVNATARSQYASQEDKARAEADRKTLAQEIFRIAGAEGADGMKHSWYNFSFCRNKWLDGSDTEMRHCWLCRRCVDGSMWHCGKCNTCRPAPRTPCFKCGGISRELAEASAASDGVS